MLALLFLRAVGVVTAMALVRGGHGAELKSRVEHSSPVNGELDTIAPRPPATLNVFQFLVFRV